MPNSWQLARLVQVYPSKRKISEKRTKTKELKRLTTKRTFEVRKSYTSLCRKSGGYLVYHEKYYCGREDSRTTHQIKRLIALQWIMIQLSSSSMHWRDLFINSLNYDVLMKINIWSISHQMQYSVRYIHYKKLSCRRETAQCFVCFAKSLKITQGHSKWHSWQGHKSLHSISL